MSDQRSSANSLIVGSICILLFSMVPALIAFGASKTGVWQFIAITGLLGGSLQIGLHLVIKRNLRCFVLPWRLWILLLGGFVLYSLVYPYAINMSESESQVLGVNLINYLWPALTVVLAVVWVPGNQATRSLWLAVAMSVGGLILSNWGGIHAVRQSHSGDGGDWLRFMPYLLGLAAAFMWAGYSTLLARWRGWAVNYATAPLGLTITGLAALAICLLSGQWQSMDTKSWSVTAVCGLCSYGIGFMLWEMALHRVNTRLLGMMAGAIPVLSTMILCLVYQYMPAVNVLSGAALIGLGIALAASRS